MTVRAPRSQHELINLLQSLLDDAHAGHTYVPDAQQFGQQEFWQPGLIGDCEDFALWCRAALKERHALDADLIFCRTETGEGHLVLCRDGFVLDNRHPYVTRRDALPYEWIALGRPDGQWHRILARRY